MCYKQTTVYTCNHKSHGIRIRACEVQEAFENGPSMVSCHTISSHPLHTYKVQKDCPSCASKKEGQSQTLSKAKELLKSVTQQVTQKKKISEAKELLKSMNQTVDKHRKDKRISGNVVVFDDQQIESFEKLFAEMEKNKAIMGDVEGLYDRRDSK